MTGLTEVDNPPSIESSEGVDDPDLRLPLSMKEYISIIHYPDNTEWVNKKIALIAADSEKEIIKFLKQHLRWIAIIPLVLVLWTFVPPILEAIGVYEFFRGHFPRAQKLIGDIGERIVSLVVFLYFLQRFLPEKPTIIATKRRVNAQSILMVRRNPKWINANLLPVWKNLVEGRAYPDKATLEQTYGDMATSDYTKLNSQVWTILNPIAVKFLEKWIRETEDVKIRTERALMILWAFNPPGRDDNSWGEQFDDMITFAQTKFALEIYSLLYNLDGGAVLHEFIRQAEENGKSFEWLKEQITGTPRHEAPCVQLLQLWCQSHNSND